MIITRCPHRVSILGGGSDLIEHLKNNDGKVLSMAINKYMYIIVNKRMDSLIRLRYFANETVTDIDDLKHDIVRYCLKKLDIRGVEIVSISDVPANCGLSSSSAFACALLMALYCYKGITKSCLEIADEVCRIELELHHTTGKQDAYGCAIDGIKFIEFLHDTSIKTRPVRLYKHQDETFLKKHIRVLFLKKRASESSYSVLKSYQDKNSIIKSIKQYCDDAETSYNNYGIIESFSTIVDLFNKSWEEKKKLSPLITDKETNTILQKFQEQGWYGKVGGAGNGGFLVLLNKQDVPLPESGLQELKYEIDEEGVKVIYNDN